MHTQAGSMPRLQSLIAPLPACQTASWLSRQPPPMLVFVQQWTKITSLPRPFLPAVHWQQIQLVPIPCPWPRQGSWIAPLSPCLASPWASQRLLPRSAFVQQQTTTQCKLTPPPSPLTSPDSPCCALAENPRCPQAVSMAKAATMSCFIIAALDYLLVILMVAAEVDVCVVSNTNKNLVPLLLLQQQRKHPFCRLGMAWPLI